MIRILIVDDHPIVRHGLIALLNDSSDCTVIAEAADADEAIAKTRAQKPDLILLDITLPGKSGLEILGQLHIEHAGAKVLVLSTAPEKQFAVRCLRAGAVGYLTKLSAPGELLNAIRKVIGGGKYVSASLANQLIAEIGSDAPAAPHQELSNREFQVLQLLGQGRTVNQISDILSISYSTVYKYRSQILRKMKMQTNAQLVRYTLEHDLAQSAE